MVNLDEVNVGEHQMTLRANRVFRFMFENLKTYQPWQYALGLFAVVVMCLLYEVCSFYLHHMETTYVFKKAKNCDKMQYNIYDKAIMVFLNLFKQTIGYALMLLVMTFNAGVLITLILSRCAFNFAFGILGDYQKVKTQKVKL